MEIKKCPICDQKPKMKSYFIEDYGEYFLNLKCCNFETAYHKNIFDAVKDWNEIIEKIEVAENCSEKIKDAIKESFEDFESHNNGGDTDYYLIPTGAKYCQDIIESRNMNFSQGNILKAAFCFGIKRGDSDYERDLNKIIWFANREIKRMEEKNNDQKEN